MFVAPPLTAVPRQPAAPPLSRDRSVTGGIFSFSAGSYYGVRSNAGARRESAPLSCVTRHHARATWLGHLKKKYIQAPYRLEKDCDLARSSAGDIYLFAPPTPRTSISMLARRAAANPRERWLLCSIRRLQNYPFCTREAGLWLAGQQQFGDGARAPKLSVWGICHPGQQPAAQQQIAWKSRKKDGADMAIRARGGSRRLTWLLGASQRSMPKGAWARCLWMLLPGCVVRALVFSPFFVMPGPFNLLRMEKTENYATRKKKKVTISFPSTIKMNNFFSRNASSSCVCIFGIQRDFLSTLSSDWRPSNLSMIFSLGVRPPDDVFARCGFLRPCNRCDSVLEHKSRTQGTSIHPYVCARLCQ